MRSGRPPPLSNGCGFRFCTTKALIAYDFLSLSSTHPPASTGPRFAPQLYQRAIIFFSQTCYHFSEAVNDMSQHAPSQAPPNEARVPGAAVSRATVPPVGKNPPHFPAPLTPLSALLNKSLIATVPRIEMQPNSLKTKEKTFSNSNKNGTLASRFLLSRNVPFQPGPRGNQAPPATSPGYLAGATGIKNRRISFAINQITFSALR